ncbi:hypothetical protein QOZ80_2AG0112350 [Eleusine coracana subsp. coracana]|nr:hypothetical protein QOZ80_2AG0112350 [Eleusine coracana subsp. coracana]
MLKRLRLDEEQSPLHRREMERKEAAVIEMVFGSNDLLAEILLRLGSPAWFVRAAAVCTRWLHRASDPIILRRFRALHPPRVLALRVASDLPVPLRQPSEFAAACRQAIATLSSSTVCDIRNGRMLVEILNPNPIGPPTFAVRNLLLPEGDKPFPSPPSKMCSISERCSCDSRLLRLLNDGGDTDNDTPCLCLDLTYSFEMFGVGYSILRSGVWTAPRSVTIELPQTLVNTMVAQKLIVGNKFYVMTTLGYILGLDLATASFFKVQLPNEARNSRDVKFSCGLDSELCLVAAKGLHLRIWHGDGAGQWVVVDTIFVPEVCRHLNVRRWIPVPDHRGWVAPVKVLAVTDNAEFVIFELVASGSACCMQVSNRVVQKMPMESLQEYTGIVRPVTMPWPPIFPADKANQE